MSYRFTLPHSSLSQSASAAVWLTPAFAFGEEEGGGWLTDQALVLCSIPDDRQLPGGMRTSSMYLRRQGSWGEKNKQKNKWLAFNECASINRPPTVVDVLHLILSLCPCLASVLISAVLFLCYLCPACLPNKNCHLVKVFKYCLCSDIEEQRHVLIVQQQRHTVACVCVCVCVCVWMCWKSISQLWRTI